MIKAVSLIINFKIVFLRLSCVHGKGSTPKIQLLFFFYYLFFFFYKEKRKGVGGSFVTYHLKSNGGTMKTTSLA